MITDMTKGRPSKILLGYSIPMMLSAAFQQIYNIADSMIAGNFAGRNALAAIGASFPVTMIFLAFATGLSIGCTVVISRCFGAGEMEKVKTGASTSVAAALAVAALLTGLGLLLCRSMILWLKTDMQIVEDSVLYLRIYIAGLPFLFLYNVANGVFLALGDSKTPLYLLILSSVSNVILDLLFVAGYHWGVAGAAWATFLCQGVCSLLAFACLLLRLRGIPAKAHPLFSAELLKSIARVGIPSILQNSFVSVGNLFVQGLINSFGVDATAGFSAAVKLNNFSVVTFTTMGNGLSAYVSQNLGAGSVERVREGLRAGLKIIVFAALPFIIGFSFWGEQFMGLFLDARDAANQNAIATGVQFLQIIAPFYCAVSVKLVCDGVLRGAERMVQFMSTTFLDLALRVGLAFALAPLFGIVGIWISWPAGWVISALLSCFYYWQGGWKKAARSPDCPN